MRRGRGERGGGGEGVVGFAMLMLFWPCVWMLIWTCLESELSDGDIQRLSSSLFVFLDAFQMIS